MHEGPSEIVIPEVRFWTCGKCHHFKSEIKPDGYHDKCRFPGEMKTIRFLDFKSGVPANANKTPTWCPVLIKERENIEMGNNETGQVTSTPE